MTITAEELRTRIAIARAATRGPWQFADESKTTGWMIANTGNANDGKDYCVTTVPMPVSELGEADAKNDAIHIAANNPQAVVQVCEELLELQPLVASMADAHRETKIQLLAARARIAKLETAMASIYQLGKCEIEHIAEEALKP